LTSFRVSGLERRIFRIGILLTLGGSLLCWILWDWLQGVSFMAGGVLGGLNLLWLRQTVHSIAFYDPKGSKRRILAGYFLRLLLIPLCLYAMIRFLFLGILALVAGFAVYNFSILIEGILEALGSRSKYHAS
jgi:hypothetical protein